MEFEVTVPGTLANLGPGFDVLGMAVQVENTFRFRVLDGIRFEANGREVQPESQLTLRTLERARKRFGGRMPSGLALDQVESVPRTRGMGSSATARVAGLVAWRTLTGEWPGDEAALEFLAGEEGHPDNVAPALLGGLTICAHDRGRLRVLREPPPPGISIALCVPNKAVQTSMAREAMPQQYTREDAIFNTSRLAFLMHGLRTLDREALRLGVQDRIHHGYRAPLIGPVDEAIASANEAGAAGAFISGSGSTLAAFVLSDTDPMTVAQAMCAKFEAAGTPADALATKPSATGARVLPADAI